MWRNVVEVAQYGKKNYFLRTSLRHLAPSGAMWPLHRMKSNEIEAIVCWNWKGFS